MSTKVNTEEKSPLLYVLEDRDDNSNTKKMYFERSRLNGITSGATAVFTHFPNYIGTCWVATALCGLVFFMMILLLLSAITTASIRIPRCVAASEIDNKSIHLVHVQNQNHWRPSEVELLQQIIRTYPSYKVRLILIEEQKRRPKYERNIIQEANLVPISSTNAEVTTSSKDTTSLNPVSLPQRRKRRIDDVRFNINMETKRLIDMLLHGKMNEKTNTDKVQKPSTEKTTIGTRPSTATTEKPIDTVEDMLEKYPTLVVEHVTYNQAFFSSPLYTYWPELNDQLKVFAVRVLQLWQFGGMSFDLQAAVSDIKELTNNGTKAVDDETRRVKQFVISEKNKYEDLPVGVVKVDDRALHMESKVPCHAFFGEILLNLRKTHRGTTVKDIMQKSIKVFCAHFSASKKYCNIFNYN